MLETLRCPGCHSGLPADAPRDSARDCVAQQVVPRNPGGAIYEIE